MKGRTPKQQAKYAEKKILEENEDFYNSIIAENYPKKGKLTKRIMGFAGTAVTAALTLTVCLVLFLPDASDTPSKRYLLENEDSVSSSLVELNANVEGIEFVVDTQYGCKVMRAYDLEYNDNLYFYADILSADTLESIIMYVYINPLYEHQMNVNQKFIKNTKIGGFQLDYEENISKDEDDIFTFTYIASTEYESVVVYLEYTQLWFEEETNFFNFFEKTVKKV